MDLARRLRLHERGKLLQPAVHLAYGSDYTCGRECAYNVGKLHRRAPRRGVRNATFCGSAFFRSTLHRALVRCKLGLYSEFELTSFATDVLVSSTE